MTNKHLIVGLGNPGSKYEKTRHNVGYWVIDELARRYSLGGGRGEKRAQSWDGAIKGRRVKLAKPLTFMNRSGEAVRPLMDFFDMPLENLIVIHDDLDTPFGSIRLRKAGGHGGQNGLRSIVQHLGSKEFARLRFGIGRPPGKMQAVDYVLQPFRGDDEILARQLTERAADAVELWLSDGIEKAMSQFNGDAEGPSNGKPVVDLEEQLALFQRAHELAPSDPKPLSKLIAVQKKLGLLDEAVANHLHLASLLDAAGKTGPANAERVKAVTIRPDLIEVQRAIAEWYMSCENTKKAVRRYLIVAEHFQKQGDMSSAMEAVETALAINPQHPKALEIHGALQDASASG